MANNKVQLSDGTTLMDLTQDTVTPQTLLSGATAHNAAGEQIVGEAASGGMTQEEADARYLQLSGGTLTGNLTLESHIETYNNSDGEPFEDSGIAYIAVDLEKEGKGKFPLIGASVDRDTLFMFDFPWRVKAEEGIGNLGDFRRVDCSGVQFVNAGSQGINGLGENDFYLPTMYDVKKSVGTKAHKVTLKVAGWDSSTKQQTVSVAGVEADETAQLILPMPAAASRTTYNDAGIQCVAQAAGNLTFQCETMPTASIDVYVTVMPVAFS